VFVLGNAALRVDDNNSTVVAIHGTPGTIYDFRYLGGELVTLPIQNKLVSQGLGSRV